MSLTKIGSIGINTGIQFAGVTTVSSLQAGAATTIHSTGIDLGSGNINSHNINSTGIITATSFVGSGSGLTGVASTDNIRTNTNATFLQNINVSGTVTATSYAGSGANITTLNASNISSGTVPTARLGSGTASSSTFLRGDSSFQTVNTDLVSDTSPQLGGDLASNGHDIKIADATGYDGNNLYMGSDNDCRIIHDGSNFSITEATGDVTISAADDIFLKPQASEDGIKVIGNGAVELYHDNSKTLETLSDGVKISGRRLNITDTGSVDLYLSADTDNSDETHVPRLHFVQDGSATRLIIGCEGSAGTAFSNAIGNSPYLETVGNVPFVVATDSVGRWQFTSSGHFYPMANDSYDIGSSSYRARNIYTNDLQLSNKGSTNDVDGTWGDYTIQEGESDLFLINNRSGKKYKFNLTEVS